MFEEPEDKKPVEKSDEFKVYKCRKYTAELEKRSKNKVRKN